MTSSARVVNYDGWEAVTRLPFFQSQLPFIARWTRGRVLDIASNYGRFSTLSPSTVSLDIDRRGLLRGIGLGTVTRAVVATARALPFVEESFDTVLAIGIVQHIPARHISAMLDDITRVTKRGGRLIIQSDSPCAPFSFRRIRQWSDELHPYSPFRLRRELRRRGWRQAGWISSGPLGVTSALPDTIDALVPWAVSVAQVHVRGA